MSDSPYRRLPAVAAVLDHIPARDRFAHADVADAVRAELASLRTALAAGSPLDDLSVEAVAQRVVTRLEAGAVPRLRPVINATGIVLHTNLGRSPLPEPAARAAYDAGRGYLNLELDLGTGQRSSRQDAVREHIRHLTGAEAATAVNNCAAATVIVLRAVAAGREVVVSRGQLVEIGGGFRIPDILGVSGATLREVGTTNITRLSDYEAAIGPNTAALMRVHASNYRIRGHTKAVGISELAALGKKHNLPVIDDVGSGAALDFARFGLSGEPRVDEGIRAGADLVLFSGDKLLGGPQAGLIAGRADLIAKVERDPLMRAFRLDKMTLAALEATLRLYRDPDQAVREIPTLRMLSTPVAELRARAERFADRLRPLPGLTVEVRDDEGFVGGGSFPDQPLPTAVVAVTVDPLNETDLAARLRAGSPAVVGRVRDGRLCLDFRTVLPHQEDELYAAVFAQSTPVGA